jgi:hypothetical protein|tara:strand:- start:479 stop:721 length:243 start_codon:yes stop_codon:yes gene_type:complete
MKNQLTLKAGTLVRLSEMGHNNFYYPGETTTKILVDCEVSTLPWLGSPSHVAIKVPTLVLHEDKRDKTNSVVWISKELLN